MSHYSCHFVHHIRTCFYYLRKKSKYNISHFGQVFTTTGSYFANYLENGWKDYKTFSGSEINWDKQATVKDYILGTRLASSVPWTEIDVVYIPVNDVILRH
ncbi:hypothetical protein PanWU01x14_047450 [Parasponia andersonii]|uniref:Uncharacterized protein n=1 Tax=Parasponia andersonii TaxID=3476 RepID=A0A2P5DN35_PARAD|nr:hypothetical protein PanWU01x14_047450 [Parasponia andersonii]